ncbi:MAG: uroporphyrinogen decarboxylase family protein [Thermoproteota archaeon]
MESMTTRERFLRVALFKNPDKIPLWDVGSARPATLKNWIKQGLPENTDPAEYLGVKVCEAGAINITSFPSEGFEWKPNPCLIDLGPRPAFPHRIIREDERHRVWVDSLGITQIGFQDDWRNGWSGFATRSWIDFPVKNREDFLIIKKRYNPRDPGRYPRNWDCLVRKHKKRNYPLCVTIRGPFWWARDMVGLKGIALGIHRHPSLIKEIMDFCAEFQTQVLHRALDDLELDFVIMSEDMAYKNGPMIGPETVKEFMSTAYQEIAKFFREHGVRILIVDSDGNVELLIPIWLKLGLNGIIPCEVAADMDVVKLGKKYPDLIMIGGIDKRELAKDKDSVKKEVDYRVPPLVKRKGYFPAVDHAVPADVPLENYKYFVSLLKNYCGWSD